MKSIKEIDIRKFSNILVFSISLIPLILFLFIIWNRISLPFVFEWAEGAGVNQIYRILSRRDLYVKPSLEFAPLVYTPLYYFLAAGLSEIFESVLLTARILSVISVIGSVFMIARIIEKETRNALLAWLAGMFYLADFALSGGFFDHARVDSLYILLVLIALSIILNAKSYLGYIGFGILLVVGFFVKQSFLVIFLPLQIYLLAKRWKLSLTMISTEIIGLSIPLYLINRSTNNWFFYYLFELPRQHVYSFVSAVNFWIGDTLRPLGILFVFGLVFLLAPKLDLNKSDPVLESKSDGADQHSEISSERWWFYVLFMIGSAGAAWVTRSSNGGGANNCMTIYAALVIIFGLGAGEVLKTRWAKEKPWRYAFIMLSISIQFLGLVYNPFNFIPTEDEIRLNASTAKIIEESEREVFIPYRSHLSAEFTGNTQIHMVNLFELTGYFKGEILPEGYGLIDQIRENICQQAYGLIILDQPVPWFEDQLDAAYVLDVNEKDLTYRKSNVLEWQGGKSRTYLPLGDYNPVKCLSSLPDILE